MGAGTRYRMLGSIALLGTVILAGCGGKSSSSTSASGSQAQSVKRLEVTVVNRSAAAQGPRSFMARAAELLFWGRSAEAATCMVSAGGQTANTDANGKAVFQNVAVDATGNIPMTFNCNGTVSTLNVPATPGTVVTLKVEIALGKVEVTARSSHVSEPSKSPQVSSNKP